jgi:hypothetical protein
MADKNIEIEGENKEIESSQKTLNEPVISPKDNDELLIEFEEKVETPPIEPKEKQIVISQEIADEVNEELSGEIDDDIIEPIPEKKVVPNTHGHKKPLHKKQAPEKIKEPKPPRDPNAKKSKKGLIAAVLILVIFGAAAYLFVLNPKILAAKFPVLVEKGFIKVPHHKGDKKIIINTETPVAENKTAATKTEEPTVSEEKVVETITKELEKPKETPVVQKKATAEVKPTKEAPKNIIQINQTGPTDRVVQKSKLQTPCWVIGYASVSKEAVAIKTVAQLSGKKCGYYWIPDYVANGPKMFKVFIGPFTTKEAAQAELPAIKTEVPAAYVMEVK